MLLKFNKVLPFPIPERDINNSEVWGEEGIFFEPNKNYLIAAESGKGKTTFVSIIYGIRKDYSGECHIEKRNVLSLTHSDWVEIRRKEISIVFQGLRLFDDLTAFENIDIKNKLSQHKSEEQITEYAELLGIAEHLFRPCGYLSFGQKQRVAIIRALCQPFKTILLDEPFSHLDLKNSKTAYNLILQESKKNNASIIITSLSENVDADFDKTIKI
jgi:putative ABC transport system ATP-binding protein